MGPWIATDIAPCVWQKQMTVHAAAAAAAVTPTAAGPTAAAAGPTAAAAAVTPTATPAPAPAGAGAGGATAACLARRQICARWGWGHARGAEPRGCGYSQSRGRGYSQSFAAHNGPHAGIQSFLAVLPSSPS